MKYKRNILGYSWVGIINIVILQWMFVRLRVTTDSAENIRKLDIIGPILPLTGWRSDYVWLWGH